MRALVILSLAAIGCQQSKLLTLQDARRFYASKPRFMQPVPYTPTPEGLPDIRAKTCGLCHKAIYEEWRISTHARAWEDDAQFMAELHKSTKPGHDVGWMCINCHTPVENQLERLVAKLEEGKEERPIYVSNPNFDPELQKEAITCAVCHVRDGVVMGPYGDTIAPHPVKRWPTLQKPEVCTQCHQAKAEFKRIALACVFDTGAEFQRSQARKDGKTCQSCHMPEVERPIATNGKPRKTRRHWFGGSLIPKKPKFTEELEPLKAHYPDGMVLAWVQPPKALAPGATATVTVSYENANAGHMLPTGDPERFIRIELEAYAQGERLSKVEKEIGSVYQWHPEVKLVSDSRLRPGERRTLQLALKAPAKGEVELRLRASKWRINEKNLEYHGLKGKYVPGRAFAQHSLKIPIQ